MAKKNKDSIKNGVIGCLSMILVAMVLPFVCSDSDEDNENLLDRINGFEGGVGYTARDQVTCHVCSSYIPEYNTLYWVSPAAKQEALPQIDVIYSNLNSSEASGSDREELLQNPKVKELFSSILLPRTTSTAN